MISENLTACPWEQWKKEDKAALWFLGQSGFYLKSGGYSVVVDPYLSDSAGEADPLYHRLYPAPILPEQLKADVYIVTHGHLDHLDPVTVKGYRDKRNTIFIAPRHAAKELTQLGVPRDQIQIVDHGDWFQNREVKVSGIFALGTDETVVDTAGYCITFANGKSVYHTSDTGYCKLLLQAAPKADILLPCINGKFGNLSVKQAVELTLNCMPRYVIPHHYDMMERNSEDPMAFYQYCQKKGLEGICRILSVMELFEW